MKRKKKQKEKKAASEAKRLAAKYYKGNTEQKFVRRSVADTVVCVAKYDNCEKFNLAESNMHYIIGNVEGVDQKIDIFVPLFNEPVIHVYCESGIKAKEKEVKLARVMEDTLKVGTMHPVTEENEKPIAEKNKEKSLCREENITVCYFVF